MVLTKKLFLHLTMLLSLAAQSKDSPVGTQNQQHAACPSTPARKEPVPE